MVTPLSLPAAVAGFLVVAVLPGFGVTAVAARRVRCACARRADGGRAEPRSTGLGEPPLAPLVLAVAWSAVVISAVGASLLALGWFSDARIATVAIGLSAIGLPSFARWCRALWAFRWTGLLMLALTVPWVVSALGRGFPSAETFQWYYWLLGHQLDLAGGIPSWVPEYGEPVRWLPDYVLFNVMSEAYRAVLPLPDATAMIAWRLPTALLGLTLSYAVFRLWLSRLAAWSGTAATSATAFYLLKFGSYKPETVGIILGLAGVWLLVEGLRTSRAGRLLLAGAVFGIAVAVHPIAAAAFALMALVAGLAESAAFPHGMKARKVGALLIVGLCALGVASATGWTLQGRVLVARDAFTPRLIGGADLTWEVLRASEGAPGEDVPPPVGTRVAEMLRYQWPGIGLGTAPWLLLPFVGATGMALHFGGGRARRGIVTLLGTVALFAGVVAVFALAFDTYVPQYTGITRLGQYLSFLAGFAVAVGVEGGLARWRARAAHGRLSPAVWIAVGSFLVGWAGPTALAELTSGPRITETGMRALEVLRTDARSEQAILTNASTHGSIEFLTGLEVPLEARQPVLEQPQVLELANKRLERTSAFFDDPEAARSILDELGVRWLLVSEDPADLGALSSFGNSREVVARLRRTPFLQEVWSADDMAVFRAAPTARALTGVGPARHEPLRWAVSVLALVALFLGSWLGLRRSSVPHPARRSGKRRAVGPRQRSLDRSP